MSATIAQDLLGRVAALALLRRKRNALVERLGDRVTPADVLREVREAALLMADGMPAGAELVLPLLIAECEELGLIAGPIGGIASLSSGAELH